MVRVRKLRKEPGINITFELEEEQPDMPWSEAPKGLVPINNTGLYVTPDEPADPRDCERYPDSIYCGNPFTPSFVEFEPSFILDECNVGVQFDGAFGFIRVPPVAIVWRKPECRNLPPPKPIESPPGTETPVPFPFNNCAPNSPSLIVYYVANLERLNSWVQPTTRNGLYKGEYYAYFKREVKISSIEYPYRGNIQRYTDSNSGRTYTRFAARINYTISTIYNINANYKATFETPDTPLSSSNEVSGFYMVELGSNSGEALQNTIYYWLTDVDTAKSGLTLTNRNNLSRILYFDEVPRVDGIRTDWGIKVVCSKLGNQNNPPPPKKLNPPPKHCCMSCCPTNSQDDSLVKLLIQKVDKLSRIVGVDEYPASLPASLISKDEGFLGNLIPNGKASIPNLTRLIGWYVERFDEIMGQWEIPIEVKDSDPTKPGDQPVGFKLPNMAEAIAEMFGLMLQTSINSETLINMNTRALLEEGQIKQQGFKTYMMATAIADHLGFEYKDTKHKIPMLFKIGEEELDKLLQESELEVTAPEHTDTSDLKTTLNDLLQAAAIIRAVHFRQFDPKGDVKQQFKNLINNLVASGDKVNNQQTDNAGKDDFDRFLEDAEVGFTNIPGVSDSTHPYGRNYNERPKIREIGTDTSESNP